LKLSIATRGSPLALWQAEWVKRALLETPGTGVDEVVVCVLKTTGDRVQDVALAQVGGKGLFTKELEEALLDRRADLAVHSLKDVPAALPPGLVIACVPERHDPRDAWVLPLGASPTAPAGIDELPGGSAIGTSSLRRASQLRARRPDLRTVLCRGNVETRLRKLDQGVDGMAALLLASAGLERLGLGHRITAKLEPSVMLPAVGQGALGIQTREDDETVRGAVAVLEDPATRVAVEAERAFLAELMGSCQVPLAALASLEGETLSLDGLLARPDGTLVLREVVRGPRDAAAELGRELARSLLGRGGQALLRELVHAG
jgi:hydroxymethylbilane synthase